MKPLLSLLCMSLAVAACASAPNPPPEPAVPTPSTTSEPLSILGTWTDQGGDTYRFKDDGSLEAPAAFEGAQKTAKICMKSNINIETCAEPSFKWLGHPTDDARYLIAMSMPLMNRVEETQELECFCPPEPGLPFSALLTDNSLVLNALQPNGAPVPGGEFTLTRQKENSAP